MVSKRKRRELDLELHLCCNPFRKRRCGRPDIEVYLMHNNEQLPICSKCWKKISEEKWSEEDGVEEFTYVPFIVGMKVIEPRKRRKRKS